MFMVCLAYHLPMHYLTISMTASIAVTHVDVEKLKRKIIRDSKSLLYTALTVLA